MFNTRSLVFALAIVLAGCNSCSSDSVSDAGRDATVTQDAIVEAAVTETAVDAAAEPTVDASMDATTHRDVSTKD